MSASPDPPTADVRRIAGVAVARLLDKRVLGLRVAALFDQVLRPLAESTGEGTLVLDFSHVAYFGSDSFGRLVELGKTLRRGGGALVLCHLSRDLREVFRVTRLDSWFEIAEDVATAVGGARPTEPG